MSSQTDYPYVINLGNSIIGVSVLAMPFCFKQCGILLGMLLLMGSGWITMVSCNLLIKGALASKRRSYELLAHYIFGPAGKVSVEISIIGLLIGTCIAFHVIIGDLGPAIISRVLDVENTSSLRTSVIVLLAMGVALPLGLLKNVESLSHLSLISLCFYFIFILQITVAAFPNLWSGVWKTKVLLWNPEGVFKCIPIFSLAFGCQSQLFIMYDAVPDPSFKRMDSIVKGAVSLCSLIYLCVGFFGYIAFCDDDISGDVLMNFRPTVFSEAIKMGFVLSVAISFPLVIFPCRAALHTLLFAKTSEEGFNKPDSLVTGNYIPEPYFKLLTFAIVLGTMTVGILVPNIEFVLAMTGATMGSLISYIFPAIMFISLMSIAKGGNKSTAQLVLFLGVTILLASTYVTLSTHEQVLAPQDPIVKVAIPDDMQEIPKEVINEDSNFENVNGELKKNERVEPPNPVEEDLQENNPKKSPDKDHDMKDDINLRGKNNTSRTKDFDGYAAIKDEVDRKLSGNSINTGEDDKIMKALEVAEEGKRKAEDEAANLLDALKEQHEQQKELLQEQKQLLKELELHKEEHHQKNNGELNDASATKEQQDQQENIIVENHGQKLVNSGPGISPLDDQPLVKKGNVGNQHLNGQPLVMNNQPIQQNIGGAGASLNNQPEQQNIGGAGESLNNQPLQKNIGGAGESRNNQPVQQKMGGAGASLHKQPLHKKIGGAGESRNNQPVQKNIGGAGETKNNQPVQQKVGGADDSLVINNQPVQNNKDGVGNLMDNQVIQQNNEAGPPNNMPSEK